MGWWTIRTEMTLRFASQLNLTLCGLRHFNILHGPIRYIMIQVDYLLAQNEQMSQLNNVNLQRWIPYKVYVED